MSRVCVWGGMHVVCVQCVCLVYAYVYAYIVYVWVCMDDEYACEGPRSMSCAFLGHLPLNL